MRHLVLSAAAFAVALIVLATLAAPTEAPAKDLALLRPGDDYLLATIERHQRETWRWQQLMGRQRTPASTVVAQSRSPQYRCWVLRLWEIRAQLVRRKALRPPRKRAWLCIHRHEGSWSDPNAPYYGGLQMDLAFQRRYGRFLLRQKGTADRWSPVEQMWVAERAYRSGRGFRPWPNTARACGLI